MSYNYFPKVLEGNKDRNSNVKHVVYGVLTRYLRFLPQKHQCEVCMRTEVFGVKQKPSKFKSYCVMWSLHLLIYEQRFKPCGFVILLFGLVALIIQTKTQPLWWASYAYQFSQDAPISALYIVVDSFIVGACKVLSWGLQKKFQLTTNFPWWYCTSAWSSSCHIFTSFTVKAGQKS